MSDNSELPSYAEVFRRLANQNRGYICVMLEFIVWKLFGSRVLLNKRWLTGN